MLCPPLLPPQVHPSLFQTIISSTTPYDTLHRIVRAAPFMLAALLAVGVMLVRQGLQLAARLAAGAA